MAINHRQASTGATDPPADRRRIGLLALALAVSWASMVFHNQELPLTLLDLENTGPLAVDIALLIVCWRLPSSRVVWTMILVWALLNMVIGGLVTVLPLPVLPFVPAQTVEHYAVHAIYAVGQLPLVLVAGGALRQLRHQEQESAGRKEIEMVEQMIETRVGRLRVTVRGERGPTALLWHSLFVDERSWDGMLPLLADRRRLVVVTGPGHGASTDPGRRYTLRECAEAALQVLDALSIREPVDWVGNAWGGHVGLIFAADRPDRCRSVVAFGTPVAALSRRERMRTRLLLGLYRLLGPSPTIVDATTAVLLSPRTIERDPDAVALVHDCLRHADRRMLRNAIVSISIRRPDLAEQLAHVAQPVLIVTGDDHHGFTPEQAREAVGVLARGKLAILPGTAYLAPLEAPTACADLVLALWRDVRAGVTT